MLDPEFKAKRLKFYVSWIQDGGYCAAMWAHCVIEADDLNQAKTNWLDLARKKVAAHTYDGKGNYKQLFRVKDDLQNAADREILDYYADVETP